MPVDMGTRTRLVPNQSEALAPPYVRRDTWRAMSRENVEVVRRIWDLYAEGTPDAVAATYDEGLLASDSTFTPAAEMPGAATYVGREGFMEFLRSWDAEFAEWSLRVEEIIDAGDDRVAVLLHQSGLGRTSGVPVETRFGTVYKFAGGQVIDRRDYNDPSRVLEAVGLSE
jgi:ketosteroid isomerase-like protein